MIKPRSLIVVALAIGVICSGSALGLSGLGTEEAPWRIQSLADFDEFAADADYWDWDNYTRLETDVNLAGRVYDRAVIGSFDGMFDGNDHKIIGLTIDDGGASNDYLGLFAYVLHGGVSNLGLEGGSVSGTGNHVGSLVGYTYGAIIANCHSTVNVSGKDYVGGLVGARGLSGSVSNCYSTGNVRGEHNVGGLVGIVFPPLKSQSAGNGSDEYDIDYLTKSSEDGISNCYATGDVNGVRSVGGLMGLNVRSVSNCYSTGKVNGTENNVAGLIGANGIRGTFGTCYVGVVSNCYWNTEAGGPKMCGDDWGCSSRGCDNSYGRTTSQLRQQSTFSDWDFINVWGIGENQTYPYLRTFSASDINKDGITNFLDLCIVGEQWMGED